MIRQQIQVKVRNQDWTIRIYYYVSGYYAEEILQQLVAIGCAGDFLQDAQVNLTQGKLDSGLAYTNPEERKAVMVIARTSSAMEFACSQQHEVGHVKSDIASAMDISQKGEEIQYIGDDIYKEMWPVARTFLCDCCRNKKH